MNFPVKVGPVYETLTYRHYAYRFDLRAAAHARAAHYSEGFADAEYVDEFKYAMEDNGAEAREWMFNSMDPSDFPVWAVTIENLRETAPTPYEDMSWNSFDEDY